MILPVWGVLRHNSTAYLARLILSKEWPASLSSSPKNLHSAPPNPDLNRSVCRTRQKPGLFSIGKFIKGEDPMFNWFVVIGVVCDGVALGIRRDGYKHYCFQLAIQFLDKPAGRIDVLSANHLTFQAAKDLRHGDRVVVMGFLSMDERQTKAGEWRNDAMLNAMDLELIKEGDHNQG
jgi:hypothetical protein